MAKKTEKTFYRVNYRDPKDGRPTAIKAKQIKDSPLGISFVALSDFIFDTGSVLVNPEEEAKKIEFEDVKTLHLSIHSIMSISEIGEHPKELKFKKDKANLLVLNQVPTESPST